MWYVIYNTLLLLASPVIVLILLAKKRCRRGLAQRLGLALPEATADTRSLVWVHAVSLGEAVAVAPLVKALHVRYPSFRIVVSTVTETGREAVEQRLAGIAEHCYAPLDFPWTVARFVDRLKPSLFLFVETELWPNLLRRLGRSAVPAVLVNGRLSSRSFGRYRIIGSFLTQVLNDVTACLMQSERDAGRMIALGARPERVVRTGNIKFDQPQPASDAGAGDLSRDVLGLTESEELLVAGSTHPVEEEEILSAYRHLLEECPSLVLMLAPRHIERASQVEAMVRAGGFPVLRRSAIKPDADRRHAGGPRVIVLDTRGELARVYRHAVLAYVGGTLVPVGGHNLLEPAGWAKPVFFGPYTDHCAEIAGQLSRAKGAIRVADGRELAAQMGRLLKDRPALKTMGEAAQGVVEENRGALERSLAHIASVLESHAHPASGLSGFSSHCRGTGSSAWWLQWPLHILSVPYAMAVTARAKLYALGWLPSRRLPCRVVSVGNLTVGGTGKTPIVIWLVETLQRRGLRVGVLSRGYKRQPADTFLLVSDGGGVLAGPDEAGDEPYLIARRCPGAVVAVGGDRYRLGRWVLERSPGIDCFVLDDGFQHLSLHRDVNLLLVDASAPDDLKALLPAGRLREPLSAAARATAVLLTRADQSHEPKKTLAPVLVAAARNDQPILVRFRPAGCVNLLSGVAHEAGWTKGQSALLFSGIGNSGAFKRTVRELGVAVLEDVIFPDHHVYRPSDLEQIKGRAKRCGAQLILTTEKDAGKAAPLLTPGDQVLALRLETEILEGQERLERVLFGEAGHA